MADEAYINPRVKVRAIKSVSSTFHSAKGEFGIEQTWAVFEDGVRTEFCIVRSVHPHPYLTMIDGSNKMVDSWHIGVSPGDLARLIMKRRSEINA